MPPIGVNQAAIEQYKVLQSNLERAGLDSANLDKLIDQHGGIEAVLAEKKDLAQYFTAALRALLHITSWDFENRSFALSGEMPGPEYYGEFFNGQVDGQVSGVDYITPRNLLDPQKLMQDGLLSPEQAEAYTHLLNHGIFGSDLPQALPEGGASRSGPYTPSTKSLSSGGGYTPRSKSLSFPEPAPFPAEGAGTAYDAGNLGDTNIEPTSFTEDEREFLVHNTNPASRMALEILFGREDQYRGIMQHLMVSLQEKQDQIRRINELLAGLDPQNPEDYQKMQQLNAELADKNSSFQMMMDQIGEFKNNHDNFTQLIKGIMESFVKTQQAIANNLRVS